MKRVKVLFKINNEVVVTEESDLTLDQINKMKNIICEECEAQYDDIDVEIIELNDDLSEIDVSKDGMYCYRDTWFKIADGVNLSLNIGSDAYFDAIAKGTLENYLVFTSKN